jgi:hypothetical protein
MIVSNIEQFEKVIPTAIGVKYDSVETYIQSSERWIETEILGKDLYSKLPIEEDSLLMGLLKNVICLKAYAEAIPFLDLIQTPNGFAVVKNENQAPASKERVNRLIVSTKDRCDNEVENLIDYLESTSKYHDDWKGAPSYSIISDCLIQTAKEFKRLCKWEGKREDFLRMKPILLLKIKTEFYPIFGHELIDELIEQQRDNDISTANSNIIDSLKFCLANFATENIKQAVMLRNSIINVLEQDIESFPKFRDSKEYIARHKEQFKNKKDSGVFMFTGGM